MKNLILSLILSMLASVSFGQDMLNTYVDAKNIAYIYDVNLKHINESESNYIDKRRILNIIKLYNDETVSEFIDSNPFLKGVIEKDAIRILYESSIDNNNEKEVNILGFNPLQINDIKSDNNVQSWQTAVLQGTADFMAERFKDEITNYALNQLLVNVTEEKSQKIELLFPLSFTYIDEYLKKGKNTGFFYSDLNLLRYNAELDLKNLVTKLPEFIKENTDNKDINVTMNIISKLASNPTLYKNPVQLINLLTDEVENITEGELSKNIKLAGIFANAFRADTESENIWINWSDINPEKIDSDYTVRFFYALLYEQLKPKYLNDNSDIADKEELESLVKKSINLFKNVDYIFQSLKEKEEILNDFSDYKNLSLSTLAIIDSFKEGKETINLKNSASALFEIEESIRNKEYKFILPSLISLMHESNLDDMFSNRQFFQTLNLLVDFTLIESSEEMKELLNTYALPIGSSSLKRIGKTNISFNGYVGLTFGYEKVNDSNSDELFNLGLNAPIGLSFSRRYSNKKDDYLISSGSIFIGILDIGALVNNSFKDEVETESDLKFQQFLVPSLGYFFNFKNSPFSAGIIGSYHFDTRKFEGNVMVEDNLNAFRLNLSFLVDIPFFTIKHNNINGKISLIE